MISKNTNKVITLGISILILILNVGFKELCAQDIIYPHDAGVINVKAAPYLAKGNGVDDDTDAIQNAIKDYINTGRTIYLPIGTYMISKPLIWPYDNGGNNPRFLVIRGQSRTKTIIQLKDNAADFQDAGNPKPMMKTSCCIEQAFRNSVRNLTFNSGKNNPGSIGLQFFASNQGIVKDVSIISGDGQGKAGLDVSFDGGLGPQMVQNLYVNVLI